MPVTNTQDEWKTRRIDIRHINPSIMEGERGHSSLFGQGSAVSIIRYAPTFLVQPSISGSFKIPSVLTCNPGVIDASPQASLFFQWKADGVDLPGETSNVITTTLAFDEVTLTCEVTAVNFLGVAVGESNGITAELIEPIVNQEYTHYTVTGLNQEKQQNLFKSDVLITTGIAQESRLDVEQEIVLITSGMWVEERDDVNSTTVAALTGLGGGNGGQLYDFDMYTVWKPTFLGELPIINPGAETGDMTGWTIISGVVTSETIIQQGTSTPPEGSRYFSAHTSPVGVDAYMQQVIDLDVAYHSDIDAGLMYAKLSYLFDTYTDIFGNQLAGEMFYLDASDNVLTSEPLYTTLYQNENWRTDYTELILMPVGTRKIRINFAFLTNSGRVNNAYLDDVRVQLFLDEHPT